MWYLDEEIEEESSQVDKNKLRWSNSVKSRDFLLELERDDELKKKVQTQAHQHMFRVSVQEEKKYLRDLMRKTQCFDIVPQSSKIVVLDGQLSVQSCFLALIENRIFSAPLWDSKLNQYTGIVTSTDFIRILLYAFDHKVQAHDLSGAKISELRQRALKHALGLLPLPPHIVANPPSENNNQNHPSHNYNQENVSQVQNQNQNTHIHNVNNQNPNNTFCDQNVNTPNDNNHNNHNHNNHNHNNNNKNNDNNNNNNSNDDQNNNKLNTSIENLVAFESQNQSNNQNAAESHSSQNLNSEKNESASFQHQGQSETENQTETHSQNSQKKSDQKLDVVLKNSQDDQASKLETIHPNASLYDATVKMFKFKLHRLPLMDNEKNSLVYILNHLRILRFLRESGRNQIQTLLQTTVRVLAHAPFNLGTFSEAFFEWDKKNQEEFQNSPYTVPQPPTHRRRKSSTTDLACFRSNSANMISNSSYKQNASSPNYTSKTTSQPSQPQSPKLSPQQQHSHQQNQSPNISPLLTKSSHSPLITVSSNQLAQPTSKPPNHSPQVNESSHHPLPMTESQSPNLQQPFESTTNQDPSKKRFNNKPPSSPIHTITLSTPLHTALTILRDYQLSSLPVVHPLTNTVVDIYSKSDVVKLAEAPLLPDLSFLEWEIRSFLTGDEGEKMRVVQPHQRLDDVVQSLIECGVNSRSRVVVVDQEKHVLGMISLGDILQFILDVDDDDDDENEEEEEE